MEIISIKKQKRAEIISSLIDIEIFNNANKKVYKSNNEFILITGFIKNDELYIHYDYLISYINIRVVPLNINQRNYKFRIKNIRKLNNHGRTNYFIEAGELFLHYKSDSYKETFTRWILPNES